MATSPLRKPIAAHSAKAGQVPRGVAVSSAPPGNYLHCPRRAFGI